MLLVFLISFNHQSVQMTGTVHELNIDRMGGRAVVAFDNTITLVPYAPIPDVVPSEVGGNEWTIRESRYVWRGVCSSETYVEADVRYLALNCSSLTITPR
jgi:hypothetical protein